MDSSHAVTHTSLARPFRAGLACGIGAALGLLGCNHDAYHYPWLVGLLHPLLIFSVMAVSLTLVPAPLRHILLSNHRTVFSIPVQLIVGVCLWVALSFGVALALLFHLEDLGGTTLYDARTIGTIAGTDQTMSRGGIVDWAMYSFVADGCTLTSAYRMEPGAFRPGQTVEVTYTSFWPRHSRPHVTAGQQRQ